MSDDWSKDEVELIVADYFAMLWLELSGEPYNKTVHRRQLMAMIGRSAPSIEFKHRNISAVLLNFGQPYVNGYKPAQNYQGLLEQAVLERFSVEPDFFDKVADGPLFAPSTLPTLAGPLDKFVEEPPVFEVPFSSPFAVPPIRKIDFVRRDAENRALGLLGEEWVLEFERRRLHDVAKRPDLATKVEWTSHERGDGAGYDISSWNGDDSSRLIEVKTTGLGKYFPFAVTANEVRVSERERARYQLYRVFNFATGQRLYTLSGAISETCAIEPTEFRARPGPSK